MAIVLIVAPKGLDASTFAPLLSMLRVLLADVGSVALLAVGLLAAILAAVWIGTRLRRLNWFVLLPVVVLHAPIPGLSAMQNVAALVVLTGNCTRDQLRSWFGAADIHPLLPVHAKALLAVMQVVVGTVAILTGKGGGTVFMGWLPVLAIAGHVGMFALMMVELRQRLSGRLPLAGLVTAGLTVLTLLFLTGLFAELPEATLAAVVIAALAELVDPAALRRLWRVALGPGGGPAARPDFVAAAAALLGVLLFDTLPGLVIGMVVSILLLLYRASRPAVVRLGRTPAGQWLDPARHPAARELPGVVVLRPQGALFFANADRVRDALLGAGRAPGVRTLVLDAEAVPGVDATAAAMLAGLAAALRRSGVTLRVVHPLGGVRDVLRLAGAADTLPAPSDTIDDAVAGDVLPERTTGNV
ncbi:hypothetical protein GCM10010123_04750 [Pilimelia anulata]|uniref:STAS domain-containing protein n=1 Tax=Pilimelia anulata TaxID=53371 RepID=A0A8J3B309_9ACTN|nr:STAS domain-containing protein [Pilimelia anulata]GGJ77748.1 hypothetical protein GCM10010123_04750 [Pilimelia anulata]